jgi:hypothetical protein
MYRLSGCHQIGHRLGDHGHVCHRMRNELAIPERELGADCFPGRDDLLNLEVVLPVVERRRGQGGAALKA